MYCKKCGKIISDDSSFCPHCGATCSKPQSSSYNAPTNYYQDSSSRHEAHGVNVVGIIGFVLSIICLFIDLYCIISIIATICSLMGLSQSDETGLKGLCVAGLVIGLIGVVLGIVFNFFPVSCYY